MPLHLQAFCLKKPLVVCDRAPGWQVIRFAYAIQQRLLLWQKRSLARPQHPASWSIQRTVSSWLCAYMLQFARCVSMHAASGWLLRLAHGWWDGFTAPVAPGDDDDATAWRRDPSQLAHELCLCRQTATPSVCDNGCHQSTSGAQPASKSSTAGSWLRSGFNQGFSGCLPYQACARRFPSTTSSQTRLQGHRRAVSRKRPLMMW